MELGKAGILILITLLDDSIFAKKYKCPTNSEKELGRYLTAKGFI